MPKHRAHCTASPPRRRRRVVGRCVIPAVIPAVRRDVAANEIMIAGGCFPLAPRERGGEFGERSLGARGRRVAANPLLPTRSGAHARPTDSRVHAALRELARELSPHPDDGRMGHTSRAQREGRRSVSLAP